VRFVFGPFAFGLSSPRLASFFHVFPRGDPGGAAFRVVFSRVHPEAEATPPRSYLGGIRSLQSRGPGVTFRHPMALRATQ
jgi:hypothetical protein